MVGAAERGMLLFPAEYGVGAERLLITAGVRLISVNQKYEVECLNLTREFIGKSLSSFRSSIIS